MSITFNSYFRGFQKRPLMKKKTDVVSGLVSEEHPFYQALTQPGKAKQHRYERRKVRTILKIADWGEEIEYEEAS
jgi:hypothetical protein